MDIKTLAEQVQEMVSDVVNGACSQYMKYEDITIRVSDHRANPQRIQGRTIIFVVCMENNYKGGKNFANVPGTIFINTDGKDESGYDIEYLLDYELN